MPTRTKQPSDRISFELSGELDRYDLLLAVIPMAFVLALSVGQLLTLPVQASVLVASVVSALAVVDALFVHPPTSEPNTRDSCQQ